MTFSGQALKECTKTHDLFVNQKLYKQRFGLVCHRPVLEKNSSALKIKDASPRNFGKIMAHNWDLYGKKEKTELLAISMFRQIALSSSFVPNLFKPHKAVISLNSDKGFSH